MVEDKSFAKILLQFSPFFHANRVNQIRIEPQIFAKRRLNEGNVRLSRRTRIDIKDRCSFHDENIHSRTRFSVSQADRNLMKGSNDRITRRFIHFQSFYKYARSKERRFPPILFNLWPVHVPSREFAFPEFPFPRSFLAVFYSTTRFFHERGRPGILWTR